ncbi:outer membrane protein [Hoeflea alexandrii]|uniref:outer membrane protein n=1 Tax=Hoeflea alexandrii TaxID=288436 RepID=UPI0022AF3C97|nr:outer membrane protein [Hoeflea alexandrii]MCZ4290369.1 porin family protein [Hoeflea alexandrii]
MIMRLAVASSLAALMGLSAPARAADLDEIIYAKELPVTQAVEIGSGWYLRGDLGYSTKTRGVATSYSAFTAGSPATYTSTPYDSSSLSGDWSGSLGVGYNFTDYLRADLSFDYSRGRFNGTTSSTLPCTGLGAGTCSSVDTQTFEQYGFMANAYVDLGTFVGFTPYVGAGAGITRVSWKPYANDLTCVGACGVTAATDRTRPGTQSWRFTYALMGGVSYDLSKDLKLDLGYRYSKIKGGNQSGFDAGTVAAGATGFQVRDNGFEKHEVRVGLRYNLW